MRPADNIWTASADAEGKFGTWQIWAGPVFNGSAATIATARQLDGPLSQLMVTTSDGRILGSEGLNDVWGPWVPFL